MATIRVSDGTNKDVSQYAAKCGKKMSEVSDEIVAAGLRALTSVGEETRRTIGETEPDAPRDGDALLKEALPAETMRLIRERRAEVKNRAKGAEDLTLVETCSALVTTGWNRIAAVQKDAEKKRAAK